MQEKIKNEVEQIKIKKDIDSKVKSKIKADVNDSKKRKGSKNKSPLIKGNQTAAEKKKTDK